MNGRKRVLALLACLALLTGCSGLSYENLYTLPRASEDYYDLQEALSALLSSGYSYAAPAAGAHQEPVQLIDLDSDGVDEAVAFLRSAETGTVSVCVLSQQEGVYSPTAMIEGAGPAVASAEYADLDGTGGMELLITYQVSESVTQALQVYRYADGEAASVVSTTCSRYELWDLDGDGCPEIVCLTGSGAESSAAVECFGSRDGELRRVGEEHLHLPYDSIRQIREGRIAGGSAAMLFSGVSAEGTLLTDVLVMDRGSLRAVAPEENILASAPVHSYFVYPDDPDGNGEYEIPVTRQLPAYDEGSGAQWVIDWYSITAAGKCSLAATTYQNFSENWFLEIPAVWEDTLTIKAGDESTAVSTVTFYHVPEDGQAQEILTIYTLRGTGRQSYAAEHELTILVSDTETILAVSLPEGAPWEGTTDLAQISELFHYTRSGWSGEGPEA